jgi:phosphoribosylanthranilate isomerase
MNGKAQALVKICGLQDEATVRGLRGLPIDMVGFMFAPSRRRVSSQQARALAAALRDRGGEPAPLAVGVFMNPTMGELRAAVEDALLDAVQMHGGESPELCREVRERLGVALYKVVSVGTRGGPTVGSAVSSAADSATGSVSDGDPEAAVASSLDAYRDVVDAILLDTYDPIVGGGTGRTFSWDRIPAYLAWTRAHGKKLIIAGGLTVDNVRELVDRYRPDGVDVSSGVETDGVKDITKIASFVERVKHA